MKFNLPIFLGTLLLFGAIAASASLGFMVSQLIRGFLQVDDLTLSFMLFFVAAIVILIDLLLLLVRKQQSPSLHPSLQKEISPEPIEKALEEPFVRRKVLRQLR